jgi:murein DD-endopeptidase MepM/ murein hydrolase activator NlpD
LTIGRALRLLAIAAVLALASAGNPLPLAHDSVLAPTVFEKSSQAILDVGRADSIRNLIAVPPAPPRETASVATARNFQRSSLIKLSIADLRVRGLLLPLPGITPRDLYDSFDEFRAGGARRHRAIDISAPVGTPVLSVDDGQVMRMNESRIGGISFYAADPSGRFIYYYAHLDAYHPNMKPGLALSRGDTIGFVGTTGNASPDSPHLHFAVLRASRLGRWSMGTPLNPYSIFH